MNAVVLVLLMLVVTPSFAEKWENFSDKTLTLRTGFVQGNLDLRVNDKNGVGQEINYMPNVPQRLFLAGSWNGLSASATLPAQVSDEDKADRGDTKADDYQLRFHFEKFSVELFYQNFKGYYVDNSDRFSGTKTAAGYLLAPDLRNEHIGANFLWNFNSSEYSMSSGFDQTQKQVGNGWSWLGGLAMHSNRFSSPVTLVPTTEASAYGQFGDVRAVRVRSMLVGAGMGGAWVPAERVFVSGSFMVFYGPEHQTVEKMGVTTESTSQAMLMSSVKGAVGYNGDRFLGAIVLQGDSTVSTIENAEVSFSAISAGFIFGMRFDL